LHFDISRGFVENHGCFIVGDEPPWSDLHLHAAKQALMLPL
jgi:hypothetical protein